ncbi:MAG: hypothetical protein HC772_05825 [Leptolyngbyaceae cyanobacterium CRU_2_3]|nr:hypothetical protein [Leptolyngbyaceae cyanobacterium CRU_2_3]
MPKLEVLAYHGWGFDNTCWRSWETRFAQQGDRFLTSDRGYFGNPVEYPVQYPIQYPVSPKIILTHSYGLHLCPIAQLEQTSLLVILSGFLEFHPCQESLRRRSQLILQQMLAQFQEKPEVVLSHFKAKCDYFWLMHRCPMTCQRVPMT